MAYPDFAKDDIYMRMTVHLLRTANLIDYAVSQVLKEYGITHIQFNILRILESSGPEPISVKSIRDQLIFSSRDVTRLLDRLETKGYVIRRICPENRRKMDVTLTEGGTEVIKKSLPQIRLALNDYFRDLLDENQAEELMVKMKQIAESITN
ncbi:MAG: MarR family transcriptional regulator [Bacteroidales bacterium]